MAVDQWIKDNKAGFKALVAFTDTIEIDNKPYTEASMNGFPETQTASKFNDDDNKILIVANKFQTGFDQPLLHTMYVDKKLGGWLLSRLFLDYTGPILTRQRLAYLSSPTSQVRYKSRSNPTIREPYWRAIQIPIWSTNSEEESLISIFTHKMMPLASARFYSTKNMGMSKLWPTSTLSSEDSPRRWKRKKGPNYAL